MTRNFPVSPTYTPCKRIRMCVGTIVVPVMRYNEPVFERMDGSRICVTRLVAADLLRMYRDKPHTPSRGW